MKHHYLTFRYDKYGYGSLGLYRFDDESNDTRLLMKYRSRTGSINTKGQLVNAIVPGKWTGQEISLDTTEAAMTITTGLGWKWRLWTPEGKWSHYLVHPDGNKPGTLGCIGIQNDDAIKLKNKLTEITKLDGIVSVFITDERGDMGALKDFLQKKVAERKEDFKKKIVDIGTSITDKKIEDLIETAQDIVVYDENVTVKKGTESAKGTGLAVLVSSIVLGIIGSCGIEVGANLETGITAGCTMGIMALFSYIKRTRANRKKMLQKLDR